MRKNAPTSGDSKQRVHDQKSQVHYQAFLVKSELQLKYRRRVEEIYSSESEEEINWQDAPKSLLNAELEESRQTFSSAA